MEIYCINMKSGKNRRESVKSKLMNYHSIYNNLKFSVGKSFEELPSDFLSLYNDDKSIQLSGRSLMKSELSCFYNHFILWKKCAQINRPMLILEDNFGISNEVNLEDALATSFDEISKYHLIKLADNKNAKVNIVIDSLGKFKIVHYKKPTNGMSGYLISPSCAKKLVNEILTNGFFDPSDIHIERSWIRGFPIYSMLPNPFYRDRLVPSIINKDKKRDHQYRIKVRRQSNWSKKNRVMRSIFNIKLFFSTILH